MNLCSFEKQVSCLVLSRTGKNEAEIHFLEITRVETGGCCQHSWGCCKVTVVFPHPLHCIPGNQEQSPLQVTPGAGAGRDGSALVFVTTTHLPRNLVNQDTLRMAGGAKEQKH